MKRSCTFVLLIACGCATASFQVAGPTSRTDSLDCALANAGNLGYIPDSGGLSSGFVRVSRKAGMGGKARDEAVTRGLTMGLVGANSVDVDQLTVQAAGGELRITASSVYENGKAGKASKTSQNEAKSILDICTR